MSDYPEHDKLSAIREESQAIGEFLEFGPGTLCDYRAAGNNGEPRYRWCDGVEIAKRNRKPTAGRPPNLHDFLNSDAEHNPHFEEWPDGYVPIYRTIPSLLAEFFGIDQEAIEREKRAMLDALRKAPA